MTAGAAARQRPTSAAGSARQQGPLSDPARAAAALDDLLRRLSRGRLRVRAEPKGKLTAHDRLRREARCMPEGPRPTDVGDRHQVVEFVRLGFLDAALPAATRPIADVPAGAEDPLFWQFPARTEAAAFVQHAGLAQAVQTGADVHVYLGLPWATWIDLAGRRGTLPEVVDHELLMQRVRIGGFRRVLRALGADLRVHTVCQHVGWRSWLPTWQRLGLTDLWLSHAPPADTAAGAGAMTLHPWHLYAVNVEDVGRRRGLVLGRDAAARPLLASFVGAHAAHYPTDTRLRLQALARQDGFEIGVTGSWHFEDAVHRRQIDGDTAAPARDLGAAVERYNFLLSNSMFSLCPAGAGPNTLRLWESLAAGAVPVLVGQAPQLPAGGTLAPIDWDSIVLRVADEQIPELPQLLRALPIEEVRRRQQLGLQAYTRVREQRCF